MTQKVTENEGKDDTGYYTPKNILNPAMFRLAEITRALSEVNMKVEQEKLFDDRRHTITMEEFCHQDTDQNTKEIQVIESRTMKPKSWRDVLKNNEDEIGKTLIICLAVSIVLLVAMLILWG
ncbi:unnamed protein product [Caenorhabditis brenneri]